MTEYTPYANSLYELIFIFAIYLLVFAFFVWNSMGKMVYYIRQTLATFLPYLKIKRDKKKGVFRSQKE